MAWYSLIGLTPCGDGEANNPFYCTIGSRDDCCETGVGRIKIPSFDLYKRQEYASSSGLLVSGNEYPSTTSITPTNLETVFRTTETISDIVWTQVPNLSRPSDSPATSSLIATNSTDGPETSTVNTDAASVQESSTSSGLSTGAKAGIGAGVAIASLLMIGLGIAALVFYRRSRRSMDESSDGRSTAQSNTNAFATDRVIPEMEAAIVERPAELEASMRAELNGSEVSRNALQSTGSQKAVRATTNRVYEM